MQEINNIGEAFGIAIMISRLFVGKVVLLGLDVVEEYVASIIEQA